ncbi:right-handed parallel beta-helix repeat-containing protein [Methanobrevibacter sp.]|uniref:right-handed parallel beta-helix repeat-containing protein n=1 Tax=Methanobrevibacter sp. TaxID=66852 RepID=UPI0025ED7918|nr:right-handed parallel beta-helix repeat-containing protein [Methanobrevibacter sp.]MBR4447144.1 right-handed parallel beta-helix repeat-containing protein [Methanobrevibacter sp.]
MLTLNICAAQEIDNSTDVSDDLEVPNEPVLKLSNDTQTLQASKQETHINVTSNTTFDVIGDYFKVKLSDSNNSPLKNTKVSFALNGKTYNVNTDSAGVASLQLRLNDGTYKIVTKYAGNSNYKASSLTTTIKMTNTRIVEAGLSNSEIQSIIDNAKANNVILFKGSSYSNINLVITKSLTLISNVGTTLKSSSNNPVITIKGKSASLTKIKGFTITGDGDGIKVDGAEYATIIGNKITTKGNGIVSLNTKYLNITKNDIVKNSKSGISLAKSSYAYIFNNDIKNNGQNGIEIAKSNNVYIDGNNILSNTQNGIYLAKEVNGINYKEGPENVQINKNTISKNGINGILINSAGNNINIKSNDITYNKFNGIAIAEIGNNKIQSNVISDSEIGIKFFDDYVKPAKQDISYNVIYRNSELSVEAKETYYQDTGERLEIGDNWYSDYNLICPKIKSNKIQFVVTQIGPNKFQAKFLDSNGNIASLLPDRILTYSTPDGKTGSITVKGGAGVFTVDAKNGDLIRATVDRSKRDNTFNSNTKSSKGINGKTPTYTYPTIPNYQLFEDIGTGGGNGNGNGNGDGSGGTANRGNGLGTQESSSNTGNSTYSQKTDPANSANSQVNDVSQSYETDVSASQASASEPSTGDSGNPGSTSDSVVKQIIIDEDEFFRVSGMLFIVLLMILTVGFYYRDDIKEMNSKR